MKNTQENILALDDETIVTNGGRVFRTAHRDLLESLPLDMVKELARRRLEDIGRIRNRRSAKNQ